MRGSLGRPWFAHKRFGVGTSGPITWQGWAMVWILAVAFILELWLMRGRGQTAAVFATAAISAIICKFKTEGGWRWRWGRDRK
jgi:hypothetical protein